MLTFIITQIPWYVFSLLNLWIHCLQTAWSTRHYWWEYHYIRLKKKCHRENRNCNVNVLDFLFPLSEVIVKRKPKQSHHLSIPALFLFIIIQGALGSATGELIKGDGRKRRGTAPPGPLSPDCPDVHTRISIPLQFKRTLWWTTAATQLVARRGY